MAGSDNLGVQFTPITQLMDMKANDFDPAKYRGGRVVYGVHRQTVPTVGDVFEREMAHRTKRQDPKDYDWEGLRKDVGESGIQTPIATVGDSVANGHHRAMMAIEQGHLFVPTQRYNNFNEVRDSIRTEGQSPYKSFDWMDRLRKAGRL